MALPRSTEGYVESEIARGSNLSIINLVNYLIEKAHTLRASDIHIDPVGNHTRIRLRIDGVLQDAYLLPKHHHQEIISRIKILARLRSDEHQSAQDGRFHLSLSEGKESLDVRVSIVPTYYGENAVLRLLASRDQQHSLESLGFSALDQEKITSALARRSGMVLVSGPTGSGKTTTLYTLIKMQNSSELAIVTIEDPIEYAIDNVRQIEVNGRSNLTFANGLRSILRQDPNIIMVGEIRDTETAAIAVNTALTGHLLLSTLHASDAATTIPRFLDMGVAPYLVASTVSVSIGQRLVRKICTYCKESISLEQGALANDECIRKSLEGAELYCGRGCKRCQKSGYFGRISINEVLVADERIQEAILRRATAAEIKKLAIASGMQTLFEDGLGKVRSGITTLDEVLRVI